MMEKRRPRRGGGWTRLGDIPWMKAPTTPPPAELFWECEECGIVEPYANPLGRWQRRTCACQRRVQQELAEAKQRIAWLEEQRTYTFGGWLGRQWINPAAVQQLNGCRFENYDSSRFPRAYEQAMEFALKPQGNLIFYGWYGVGKTHLEAAIANYLRELPQPRSCLFASAPQFFMAYDDARRCEGPTDHYSLMHRATTTSVLILDDVDKCKHTETRQEVFYTLFNERYLASKPTIVSLNNLEDLPAHIGDAACSRLSRGLSTICMVDGTDYRQEQI